MRTPDASRVFLGAVIGAALGASWYVALCHGWFMQ